MKRIICTDTQLDNLRDALMIHASTADMEARGSHWDISDSIITSLIYRHYALDEMHAEVMNDHTWEYFEEWETLQNWLESAEIDYYLDSDDIIHLKPYTVD